MVAVAALRRPPAAKPLRARPRALFAQQGCLDGKGEPPSAGAEGAAPPAGDGERGELRQLLALSLPALGGSLVDPALRLTDTACAGQFSGLQQAALAPSGNVLTFIFALLYAFSMSVTNFVAARPLKDAAASEEQLARRREECNAAVAVATLSVALLGTLAAVALRCNAEGILSFAGARGELLPVAASYLRISAIGIPMAMAATVFQGAYLGQQDAVFPFKVLAAAGLVNLTGDLLLPRFFEVGLLGVGLATVAAQSIAFTVFLVALRRRGRKSSSLVGLRWPGLRGLRRSGVAVPLLSVTGVLMLRAVAGMLSYSLMAYTATGLPTAELAAHQCTFQLFWLLSFAVEPLSTATQSLVGRDRERSPERGARLARAAMRFAVTGAALLAAAQIAVQCSPLGAILTRDAEVQRVLSGKVALVAAASQLPTAAAVMCDGIAIATGYASFLPRIFLLGLAGCVSALFAGSQAGLGVVGVWLGMHAFVGARLLGHLIWTRRMWRAPAGSALGAGAGAGGGAGGAAADRLAAPGT